MPEKLPEPGAGAAWAGGARCKLATAAALARARASSRSAGPHAAAGGLLAAWGLGEACWACLESAAGAASPVPNSPEEPGAGAGAGGVECGASEACPAAPEAACEDEAPPNPPPVPKMLVLGVLPGVPAAALVPAGGVWGRLAGKEGGMGVLKVKAGGKGAAVVPVAKHVSDQKQQHVTEAVDHCRLRVHHARA